MGARFAVPPRSMLSVTCALLALASEMPSKAFEGEANNVSRTESQPRGYGWNYTADAATCTCHITSASAQFRNRPLVLYIPDQEPFRRPETGTPELRRARGQRISLRTCPYPEHAEERKAPPEAGASRRSQHPGGNAITSRERQLAGFLLDRYSLNFRSAIQKAQFRSLH